MAKTELYRKPTPPGYLGGYNWRATALGLLSLVLVSLVATEYIASKFHYQAALGPPMARKSRAALYEPFAWMIWGWKHATSTDIRIRRPFFEGEMIVVIGSFLCVGVFFVITNRAARKLSANADDLHGSARWADSKTM